MIEKSKYGRWLNIGRLSFGYEISSKKTCWFYKPNNTPRSRVDVLLGLDRIYFRPIRLYTYVLTIGRLRLLYINFSKALDKTTKI